jgi:spore maturation protein SpmA
MAGPLCGILLLGLMWIAFKAGFFEWLGRALIAPLAHK